MIRQKYIYSFIIHVVMIVRKWYWFIIYKIRKYYIMEVEESVLFLLWWTIIYYNSGSFVKNNKKFVWVSICHRGHHIILSEFLVYFIYTSLELKLFFFIIVKKNHFNLSIEGNCFKSTNWQLKYISTSLYGISQTPY